MNEYQRQAYLGALGLEQYVPRWLLPCAPDPVVVELPELPPETLEAAPVSLRAGQGASPSDSAGPGTPDTIAPLTPKEAPPARSAPQPLTEVLRDMSLPAEKSRRESPEAAASANVARSKTDQDEATPTTAERVSPFSLSIWRSSLPLLVLDARQPRSAMPTERLLRNLLSALSAPGGDPQTRPEATAWEEILPWPSVNNPAVHLRLEDARAELHTWLEIELSQRPAKQMLLMGENAARHFLPEGASYQELLWQSVALEPSGSPALIVPSLLELLQEPALKRNLWQALQPVLPL